MTDSFDNSGTKSSSSRDVKEDLKYLYAPAINNCQAIGILSE
jgi:hypothetical protein